MFEPFRISLAWSELFKRTVKESIDDGITGLAAQLAYYFFLALFPALLFLVALASYFPLENLMDEITGALSRFAPGDVLAIVQEQLKMISNSQHGGLLTIGFIGTLWSVSSAMAGIIDTLNKAYEIQETRPFWKVRLMSAGLTIAVGLFVLISFALIVVGPQLAEPVAEYFGLGPAFAWTWKVVQWPIVFLLVSVALGFIYYFGPDAEQQWEWITPGSLLATLLWVAASLGFRFYVTNFGNYNETYGTIGGVIIALLWLYITGIVILIGAELNAEIEHASAWGKSPGEKRTGEKKKLGRVAAADYERRQRERAGRQAWRPSPLAPAPSGVVLSSGGNSPNGGRISRWALGSLVLVGQVVAAFRRRRV
ncbi:MAG: YihY/virulence factor BrkB family protein [Acidobacteria bacterium]|nr:MAG: YihY/virulence factor BrkB family protein [Acidobacteriota bacterium]